ncbi:auxin response factor 7, partial [Cyclospora cayetanensis]|uniref:Auxin response factor 7 n=1 Tax=Cyclospora cayetanensis TaxID=88456 RepID=A0A6P6RPB6_9EIME
QQQMMQQQQQQQQQLMQQQQQQQQMMQLPAVPQQHPTTPQQSPTQPHRYLQQQHCYMQQLQQAQMPPQQPPPPLPMVAHSHALLQSSATPTRPLPQHQRQHQYQQAPMDQNCVGVGGGCVSATDPFTGGPSPAASGGAPGTPGDKKRKASWRTPAPRRKGSPGEAAAGATAAAYHGDASTAAAVDVASQGDDVSAAASDPTTTTLHAAATTASTVFISGKSCSAGNTHLGSSSDVQKQLQQLFQLHQSSLLLQQRELDLAVKELELQYLPLLWRNGEKVGGCSNTGISSGIPLLWDVPLHKFVSWKGERAKAFSALGEGKWALWPASRPDTRCELLQQQLLHLLQRMAPMCTWEQQQQQQQILLQVLKLWSIGNSEEGVHGALATQGCPEVVGSITSSIIRLPPPSCFSWDPKEGNVPFVWKPVGVTQPSRDQRDSTQRGETTETGLPQRCELDKAEAEKFQLEENEPLSQQTDPQYHQQEKGLLFREHCVQKHPQQPEHQNRNVACRIGAHPLEKIPEVVALSESVNPS